VQHQLKWKKFDFVFGARLEKHNAYTNQFNPKFSFLYRLKPTVQIRGSVGRGFKKPTFKQLFFNYTNEAIGYSVFGTTYLEDGIAKLIANNQIMINPETNQPVIYQAYYDILSKNGVIEPESSIGYNLGIKLTGLNKTIIDINIFRNDLKNLIDTTPVALKTNGWRAYSYLNLNSVFTNGFDVNIKYHLNNNIKISLGYQYLDAKDKDVLDKIENEGIYAQDLITHQSYRITKKDYGGLFNRSKHTGNFKVYIKNIYKEIQGNIRVLYTGKYGFSDLNNNGILDLKQEYTDGYFLVNTAVSKSFLKNKLHFKVGVDNLLDFTYIKPEYTITSLPGRIFYTTINYTF
jgi:outer membrane receptor for ferrienterochelin and colicins